MAEALEFLEEQVDFTCLGDPAGKRRASPGNWAMTVGRTPYFILAMSAWSTHAVSASTGSKFEGESVPVEDPLIKSRTTSPSSGRKICNNQTTQKLKVMMVRYTTLIGSYLPNGSRQLFGVLDTTPGRLVVTAEAVHHVEDLFAESVSIKITRNLIGYRMDN